jgi:hypothetical protein
MIPLLVLKKRRKGALRIEHIDQLTHVQIPAQLQTPALLQIGEAADHKHVPVSMIIETQQPMEAQRIVEGAAKGAHRSSHP